MWNWLASALASQATVILYDGSPFYPSPTTLFDLADELSITLFGVSAKYIDACANAGISPIDTTISQVSGQFVQQAQPLLAKDSTMYTRKLKKMFIFNLCLAELISVDA